MRTTSAVEDLRRAVCDARDEAGLTACQFALALNGDIVITETLGGTVVPARFNIFSATKPLVASVVWQLIGEGLLDPEQPVASWWPEFAAHGKAGVTLEQVMVHTAGFPSADLTTDALADRGLRVREMQDWTLESEPGTQYAYHGLSAHWVLAELIERTTGQDCRRALRERVLDPLGLERLELGVPRSRQHDLQPLDRVGTPPSLEDIEGLLGVPISSLPPTVAVPARGPETIDVLASPGVLELGVAGGGAISDAASLALFYQHLLHDPKQLWDPRVLRDATSNVRNVLPDMLGRAAYRTLGLEVAGDDDKAAMRIGAGVTSAQTFGHAGAGGQVAWADPATGLSFVFLTSSIDVNFVRMYRRDMALTRAAARCADDLLNARQS